MNLVIDIDQFNSNYVHFQESVKNTIMDDSNFIRILYSNNLFILNGIFLKVNIKISHIDKYFNKYKWAFNYDINKNIIEKISIIERTILQMINISNKCATYRISEQLHNENIKLFTNSVSPKLENEFILKISGIWENDTEYGITYKFIDINNPNN